MPNIFRSREGALTTEDTKTQLTTIGSRTSPGALLVPGASTHLRAAYVSVVSSNESAGQNAYLVRLEGPGIKRGSFVLNAGASGGAVATGGNILLPSKRLPINIEVNPGQEVLVFAEALGADSGTYQAEVTLEFGDSAGPEGVSLGEVTVENEITAVDTLTRLTAQGSVAAPSRLTPPDAKLLKRLIYSVASDAAADGEVTFHVVLSGDAVKGGEQIIVLGGSSFIDVQSGSDAGRTGMSAQILDNLDIEIAPNETLDISVEMCGVDIGTATAVVTAILA